MKDDVKRAFRKFGPAVVAAKLALVAAFALAGQGHAAPNAGAYALVLAAPVAQPRQEIVDGLLWKCAGESCSAPAQGGRPVITCARVARKIGAVARFSSPQGELSADELARCNAR